MPYCSDIWLRIKPAAKRIYEKHWAGMKRALLQGGVLTSMEGSKPRPSLGNSSEKLLTEKKPVLLPSAAKASSLQSAKSPDCRSSMSTASHASASAAS